MLIETVFVSLGFRLKMATALMGMDVDPNKRIQQLQELVFARKAMQGERTANAISVQLTHMSQLAARRAFAMMALFQLNP